jgi:threonine/homoserine/homoserine lactone efflux protein
VTAMLAVLSGLYYGIRDSNLALEVQALATGIVLFYLANWFIKKSPK